MSEFDDIRRMLSEGRTPYTVTEITALRDHVTVYVTPEPDATSTTMSKRFSRIGYLYTGHGWDSNGGHFFSVTKRV